MSIRHKLPANVKVEGMIDELKRERGLVMIDFKAII